MTDDPAPVDLVALLKECRMGLSVLLGPNDPLYDPRDQARELIGRIDRIVSELRHQCPACPVEVRGLYAVASNTVNLVDNPDRWERKIGERMAEMKDAVDKLMPIVDAHFKALGMRR